MTDASEWTGRVGDAWAEQWRRTDAGFADLAGHLDSAIRRAAPATPTTGVAIDIGCGAGTTSISLATARPDLGITGVDLSPALIAVARERGAGHPNLTFIQGSIQSVLPSLSPASLLFSRHGVMFFDDPVAGLSSLRNAAAPGSALVFSCFRAPDDNPWASEVGAAITGTPAPRAEGYAPGPFAFADPVFVGDVLAAAGWQSDAPVAVDFRYRAGAGPDPVDDALDFFGSIGPAAPLLRAAPVESRALMLDRLRGVVERHASADAVDFPAAAWLWSAHAA